MSKKVVKNKIGKNEFITMISNEFPDVKVEFINTFISVLGLKILELTKEGYEVKFGSIGTFYLKKMSERKGIDPKTKKEIIIPKYNTLKFKVSSTYKKLLNK